MKPNERLSELSVRQQRKKNRIANQRGQSFVLYKQKIKDGEESMYDLRPPGYFTNALHNKLVGKCRRRHDKLT
jgi:hypothetical protein